MLPCNMNMMKKARFVCAITRMTHVARHFLGEKTPIWRKYHSRTQLLNTQRLLPAKNLDPLGHFFVWTDQLDFRDWPGSRTD